MATFDVKMVILSTDDLDASIAFYNETLGLPLKFRDGSHKIRHRDVSAHRRIYPSGVSRSWLMPTWLPKRSRSPRQRNQPQLMGRSS